MTAPPPIDGRTTDELAAQTEQLAQHFSGWVPPADGSDFGRALIAVFAEMAAQVVARLNHVPARDQLAFFDLLGVTPLPARAARVPLTFALADGQDGVLVPAGTVLAAANDAGAPSVLFETERDVTLVAAQVATVVAHEPGADRSADVTAIATTGVGGPFAAFTGDTLLDHLLYLAHDQFLALPSPRRLTVRLEFGEAGARDAFGRLGVEWQRWDGAAWAPVAAP